jgi:hypothetical protein
MEGQHMNGTRNGWLVAALAVIGVAIAAAVAYNVGLSQGLAQAGAAAGSAPPTAYGWHRPWGFGPLFPLLFIFFWIFVIRSLWWRPWGHWYYDGPPRPMRDRFDEWHRQAHERTGGAGEAGKT